MARTLMLDTAHWFDRTWLRCSRSRARLVRDGERLVSTDEKLRLAYAIVDGIPNMLAEEASELSHEEWAEVMRRQQQMPSAVPSQDQQK